ncbi:hypothetical protein DPMN_153058 [Dreissena polymorpha]|uniref:Uncharacterized protein n=1 Tax=Dreissena polymorpha TaxID=45954 RepID=A0A9D4FIM0_DREPO|nr:hypothetical protein DPMN_153058 [Dreissena polymorpha]
MTRLELRTFGDNFLPETKANGRTVELGACVATGTHKCAKFRPSRTYTRTHKVTEPTRVVWRTLGGTFTRNDGPRTDGHAWPTGTHKFRRSRTHTRTHKCRTLGDIFNGHEGARTDGRTWRMLCQSHHVPYSEPLETPLGRGRGRVR